MRSGRDEVQLSALIRFYYLTHLESRDREWYEGPVNPLIYSAAKEAVGVLPDDPSPDLSPEVSVADAARVHSGKFTLQQDRHIRAAFKLVDEMRHRPTRWAYFEYCAWMQSPSLWIRFTTWLEWRLRIVVTAIAWALGLSIGLPALALGLIALEVARQLHLGAELISNARTDAFQVVVSGATLKMAAGFNRAAADSIVAHRLINEDDVYNKAGFWIALAALGSATVDNVARRVVAYRQGGALLAVKFDDEHPGPAIGTPQFTAHIMHLRETKESSEPLASAKNDVEYLQYTWLEDGGQTLMYVQNVFVRFMTRLVEYGPKKTAAWTDTVKKAIDALRRTRSDQVLHKANGIWDSLNILLNAAKAHGMLTENKITAIKHILGDAGKRGMRKIHPVSTAPMLKL